MTAFLVVYLAIVPVCLLLIHYIHKNNLLHASWGELFRYVWQSHCQHKDFPSASLHHQSRR